MTARLLHRAVAAALALALLAGGVVVAVEIAVAAFGAQPWVLPHGDWYRAGVADRWSSSEATWLFLAVAAAGVALLALQVARRRPDTVPLGGGSRAELSRRSLERSLARTAQRVDGVATARAKVSPARATVEAATNRRLVKDLQPRVAEATTARLRAVGLADTAVAVAVKAREER